MARGQKDDRIVDVYRKGGSRDQVHLLKGFGPQKALAGLYKIQQNTMTTTFSIIKKEI